MNISLNYTDNEILARDEVIIEEIILGLKRVFKGMMLTPKKNDL
jgi:hypothetical protein